MVLLKKFLIFAEFYGVFRLFPHYTQIVHSRRGGFHLIVCLADYAMGFIVEGQSPVITILDCRSNELAQSTISVLDFGIMNHQFESLSQYRNLGGIVLN